MGSELLPEHFSEAQYRAYYERNFVKHPRYWHISEEVKIPIYFHRDTFDHAFFESTKRDGNKDLFSPLRAQRMSLIQEALTEWSNERYVGWDNKRKSIDITRCVCVRSNDNFIVVLRLGITQNGDIKGKFITCYVPDDSAWQKITSKDRWDYERSLELLRKR